MEPIKKGTNPRDVFARHRERGPQKFEYSYDSVAEAAGVSPLTVRSSGLDVRNLKAVARYIEERRKLSPRRLKTEDFVRILGGERYAALWEKRWPLFQVFYCREELCKNVLLHDGTCRKHGGYPQFRLGVGKYIECLIDGKWVPYHRLVAGCPYNMHVHHVDHNKYNNHPSNFKILTHDEHMKIHGWFKRDRKPKEK